MKLREGLSIIIGRMTYRDEIPDDRFAAITRGWPKVKVDGFIRNYGAEIPITKMKEKEEKDD